MIEHIVMIKIKENSNKIEISNLIKQSLENLPNLIKEIKYYQVGLNLSKSPTAYDIVLISRFDNFDTLEEYRVNPEHQKVLDIIKTHAEKTAVVDFEK
ncbi:MAG: Dabb family protein [Bacteroidales bacterium]|nr:Dabb family protein [Bacteroidales bacterium]MBN2757253.1 Dabb family protein [Bacteroidales bacterium]